ncbi:LysR family transcriptional regulator [Lentisphaerota bacterium WC36G]|nr:LysR family transcriptional regulator [Lentisphaerae bacterium WC36]
MDQRLLKYFIAVYEEKSVTAAAKKCFISQPALSNAIKQLEEELNCQLFIRLKRGVKITGNAEQFYPQALKLAKDMDNITKLFEDKGTKNIIKIGVYRDFDHNKLAKFYKHLYETIPNLYLKLLDYYDDEPIAKISPDCFKGKDDIFLKLWDEDYVLSVPKNHQLTKQKEVTINDLAKYPFIEYPSCEPHQRMMGILSSEGVKLNIVATATHKSQVMHLVESGIAISFIPTGTLAMTTNLVQLKVKGIPRMYRTVGLQFNSVNLQNPKIEALSNSLEKFYNTH